VIDSQTAEFINDTKPNLYGGGPGSGCHGDNCGRPRGVKQTFQTHSGYSYSIMQPSRRGIKKGSHSLMKRSDQFKGKYSKTEENVKPFDIKKGKGTGGSGSVYDAKYGKGDRYEGHGKTIFVHKDYANNRVVVHEVPHDEMNHSATVRAFKFKNFGQAAGFLNKRYGIKQKFPTQNMDAAALKHNPWACLAGFAPERVEDLFEHVFSEYGQGFKPLSCDKSRGELLLELKDGRQIKKVL
jgi:hypothetical protein